MLSHVVHQSRDARTVSEAHSSTATKSVTFVIFFIDQFRPQSPTPTVSLSLQLRPLERRLTSSRDVQRQHWQAALGYRRRGVARIHHQPPQARMLKTFSLGVFPLTCDDLENCGGKIGQRTHNPETWNFFFCVCAWEVERGSKTSFDRLALEQPVGNHG